MELIIDQPGIVLTESSSWSFDGLGHFCREPRDPAGTRATLPSVDDSLNDGVWVEFRTAWVEPHPFVPGALRIGLIPAHRPADSSGIRTGVVVASTFPLTTLPDSI
jgi:hypothetical protein